MASRALQSGLIDTRLADAINKLGLLDLLARMDQDRVTPERAAEFVNLSAIVSHLIQSAGRSSHSQPVTTGRAQESWLGSGPGMAC